MGIIYKSRREIELIRAAGRIVAGVLEAIGELVAPGVTTGDLRRLADGMIRDRGGEPVFPKEAGFPASICTSVNEEVVHGVPGKRRLAEGDVVSVDVGVRLRGYIGDAARTFPVGEIDAESARLLEVGRGCLDRAIGAVTAGRTSLRGGDARRGGDTRRGGDLSEVSRAIQSHAEANGFSVVREFVGHGVGEKLHEKPQVPNFVGPGGAKRGIALRPGMVIAIEPMVNVGTWKVKKLADGWTVVTRDGRRSCHFEHTVAVGENGAEILTLP